FGISLIPGTTPYGAKMNPVNETFANYIYLLTDENSKYLTWYKKTSLVAAANALCSAIFVKRTSYAVSRYRVVGRKYDLISVLILKVFPVLRAMVASYYLP
ncbi:sugar ABC transporter permease, partial [Staphylococcus pseudintermedius]